MDIVFGLIYYMIIAWLILNGPRHFHRSEIDKTYKGAGDFESEKRPEQVIETYGKYHMVKQMGYQLIDHKDGKESFMIYHKAFEKAPIFEYLRTDNFFKKKSIKNIAHTLKILSFSHLIFHSLHKNIFNLSPKHRRWNKWYRNRLFKNSFLSFTKWLFAALSVFTIIVAILAGDRRFVLEFLPFVLILTVLSYMLYVLREVWLYFKQNRYSAKLAEEMGFKRQEIDYIRRYSRYSLIRFIILQMFIIIFIFVLIIWLLIAFNAK